MVRLSIARKDNKIGSAPDRNTNVYAMFQEKMDPFVLVYKNATTQYKVRKNGRQLGL